MNITEFLEARIAEDEAKAREFQSYEDQIYKTEGWFDCTRVLAECAAKRAIMAQRKRSDQSASMDDWSMGFSDGNYATIRALTEVYRDHPDYQQEWSLNTP